MKSDFHWKERIAMGVYLNSRKSGSVFRRTAQSRYFVDKTAILDELIPTVEQKKTAEDGQERQRHPVHLHYPAAPFWKDGDGQYDRVLFWKGRTQPGSFSGA